MIQIKTSIHTKRYRLYKTKQIPKFRQVRTSFNLKFKSTKDDKAHLDSSTPQQTVRHSPTHGIFRQRHSVHANALLWIVISWFQSLFFKMWLRFCTKRKTYAVILAAAVISLALLANSYWKVKRTYLTYPVLEMEQQIEIADHSNQSLLLFIGIYSAPIRLDRRTALRETWLQKCHNSERAVCRFVTDGQDVKGNELQGEMRTKLENESRLHGDLLLAETPGGINFPRRYLWMAKWASERYNFQYFLRLDDDYFVCFDKVLLELEFHRPKKKFQWGWLHCSNPGYVAIDEGFSLVSRDLIETFLSKQNSTLMCHMWDGQAIALWLQSIPIRNVTTFGDNARVFHISYVSKEKAAKRQEICRTAIAIHKSYPEEMRIYWSVYQRENKTNVAVPPLVYPCHMKLGYDHRIFRGQVVWYAEPKLCKDNPIWDNGKYFPGRQEGVQ